MRLLGKFPAIVHGYSIETDSYHVPTLRRWRNSLIHEVPATSLQVP
jgi:hypothetical protein